MFTKLKSLPLNAQPNSKGLKSNSLPENGTIISNNVAVKELDQELIVYSNYVSLSIKILTGLEILGIFILPYKVPKIRSLS